MARADTHYSGDFYMIGVIHRDERNPEVLPSCIDRIRPDVITVEISQYSIDFRRLTGNMYREKLKGVCTEPDPQYDRRIADLTSFIDMPSEYAIADAYCRQHNIHLYPVDMDLFSRLKLGKVNELTDRKNIMAGLAPDAARGKSEKILANLYFDKGVAAFNYDEEMAMRDNFICHRIAILRKRYKGGRLLHIAGWQHLRDPLSLYDSFHPVKIYPYD
jgi:hypothetical protein